MTRVKQQVSPNATAITSPFYVRWFYLIIALCITVCYAAAIQFEFLPTDDTWLIAIRLDELKDIRNLPSLFTEATYNVFYRPMLHLSYMLDAQIPLTTVNVMHVNNIIYHLLVCFALFHFLKLIELKKEVAAVVCLIAALHPMNVQAVAWISGRNDSLLALFLLLSCNTLLSYFRTKDYGRLLLHFVFFAAALLTKETAIIIPLLYLLLIVWFVKGRTKSQINLLALMWIALCAARIILQTQFVSKSVESDFIPTLIEFFNGLIMQTGKILIPVQQSAYPLAEHTLLWPYIIAVSAFAFLCVRVRFQNNKLAAFGIIWFTVIMFLPTWFGSSITPAVHYEHRVYSAMPGLLLVISQLKIDWSKLIPRISIPAVLCVLFFLAWSRERVYKSYASYVTSCIKDAPNVAMFHDFAGLGFQENKRDDQAVKCFNVALSLDSTRAEFYNHRGVSWLHLKQYGVAIVDFEKANQLRPSQRETSYNLSLAHYYVREYNLALNYLKEADSLGAYIAADYANALNRALTENR